MNVGRARQFHAAMAGGFGSLVMGSLNVWPSYTSSIYSSNTTTTLSHPMTQAEESLLGSLPSLGAMLGTAIVGTIINKFGRRNGGVLLSLPFVVSWAIIAVSSSINIILAARFVAGIGGGAYLGLAPIFTSEVAEDAIRGALASSSIYLYCVGCLVSTLWGWYFTYRTIVWMNLVLSLGCTVLIMLVVESPMYLIRQKRDEDARLAISKYRGQSVSSMVVLDELSRLKQQVLPAIELITVTDVENTKAEEAAKEKLNPDDIVPEKVQKIAPIKLLFYSQSSRRGFFVVFCVITLQVFMGIVPVQVYASTVFKEIDPSKANLYSVVFFVIQLVGSLTTAAVADKAGRRLLIIMSGVFVAICLITLGVLTSTHMGPQWLIIVLIFLYCFNFMYGAGSVPYVLLAEVFVPEVQSVASMMIIEWVWFLNFVIVGVFPYMIQAFGICGVYYMFGCTAVVLAVYSFIFVPETKGLSNEQIQDLLTIRKKK